MNAHTTDAARHSALDIAAALELPTPTPEQTAIIEAPPRPLLVVAGAGSGKTETMSARVVWLVANKFVEPDQVLGLTFTRKAAGELAERIGRRLRRLRATGLWTPGLDADGTASLGDIPTVQTYHAYAGRLVSEHALRLGIEPESRLLSEAAAWQFAAEVVHSYDGPMDQVTVAESTVISAVVSIAGEVSEHLRTPQEMTEYLERVLRHSTDLPLAGRSKTVGEDGKMVLSALSMRTQFMPIVQAYLDLKRERSALDFADQMAIAAKLTTTFPQLGSLERQRFRAVLLDEFQDTSEAQMAVLRGLFVAPGEPVPVTAVGDPNQSIYGWRGASATTLARFPQLFTDDDGDAEVLQLSRSWRNDDAILRAANRTSLPLRDHSPVPIEVLHPRPGSGPGAAQVARLATVEDEAAAVADWIAERWFTDGSWANVSAAVLCRKRSLFTPMSDALRERGVPIELVGIGGLLSTPEVGDLVSLLWVVQDPTRGDRLMRLLTGPAVRLGPADLDGLAAWSRQQLKLQQSQSGKTVDIASDSRDQPSIIEAIDDLPPAAWRGPNDEFLSPAALERLRGLAASIGRLRTLTGLPLAELAAEAERILGLDIEVLSRPEHTAQTARVHLDAFADVAAQFSSSADRPTLGGFLAWLDAAEDEERGLDLGYLESAEAAVQILTIHAAKGLEWDYVAVPGMVEGTFPSHPTPASWHAELNGWKISPVGEPGNPASWRTRDRGWTGGASGGVPFDLRGDADGLPEFLWETAADVVQFKELLEQFLEAGGDHEIASERRLAYVALTRARREMLLTGAIWGDGKTPRLVSRFVSELLDSGVADRLVWEPMPTLEPGQKSVENPREATQKTAEWPTDPLAKRRAQLADGALRVTELVKSAAQSMQTLVPMDQRELEIDELLRERQNALSRTAKPVLVPRHLSASAVVALAANPADFALKLRRPMPSAPALAARRGTAFHAWVEQHYNRAALVDIVELPGAADEDADTDANLSEMKDLFLKSPWADRVPSDIEIAVETWIDGISVRGRIDAVFPRDGGGFTIVDWKTGAMPSHTAAQSKVLQLAAYRLAFARLRGLAPQDVDAAFYYAGSGTTVFPELPDENDLRRLLAQLAG